MKLRIISFTKNGLELSKRIAFCCNNDDTNDIELFTRCSNLSDSDLMDIQLVNESIGQWTKEQMQKKYAILFIGACAIAVRAIAPFVTDKLHDTPVLVMDELGRYIIPILSGHVGGANEIAVRLARMTNALPVITTATDINGKFAVDLFAKKNGLEIVNKEGIAKVSSKVLSGKEIVISIECGHIDENLKVPYGIKIVPYPPKQSVDVIISTKDTKYEAALYLKPMEYVIGMGCKRGKETYKIDEFICNIIKKNGISKNQIYALASIDIKKNEEGLNSFCRKENIPFLTFSANNLQNIDGSFSSSDFVKEKTGVDNVCERAAVKACGENGKLVCKKYAHDGMTIAIAKRDWRISFDEK